VREERTIGWLEGLALHLTPQHGYLVTKCEKFDLVGVIGASKEKNGSSTLRMDR
jgi:hypothetical protein